MSLFEELGELDRPWVEVEIAVGDKKKSMLARVPSAAEQDEIDAYYMDEFSRLLTENVVAQGDKISERDRVANIYATRSKEDIVSQLLPTRAADIKERTQEATGINIGEESLRLAEIADDEERKIEAEALDLRWKQGEDNVKGQILDELMTESFEVLVKRLAEVNINIKVQMQARKNTNARLLQFVLYYKNADGTPGAPAFESLDEILKFKPDTIDRISKHVQEVLLRGADLPLESPGGAEPAKPLSSPSISEEVTPTSGEPTTTTNAG